jgi:hypothetical protein
MELIDIIQSSVTIFGGGLFLLVISSFIIFKIKDKNRVKPYSTVENKTTVQNDKKVQVNPARPVQVNKAPAVPPVKVVNQTPIYTIPEAQNTQPNVMDYYAKNKPQHMHKVRFSVQNANFL